MGSKGEREEARGDLARQLLSCQCAGPAPRQGVASDPRDKSSSGNTTYRNTNLAPNAVPFWQRHTPFSPNDDCLSAKGDLLSIVTQGLLPTPGRSPPGLDHGIATWHTYDGCSLPGDWDLSA